MTSNAERPPLSAEKDNNVQIPRDKATVDLKEVIDVVNYVNILKEIYSKQGLPKVEANLKVLDRLHKRFQELAISAQDVVDQLAAVLEARTGQTGDSITRIIEDSEGLGEPPLYTKEPVYGKEAALEKSSFLPSFLDENGEQENLSIFNEAAEQSNSQPTEENPQDQPPPYVDLEREQDSPSPDTEETVVEIKSVQVETKVIEDTEVEPPEHYYDWQAYVEEQAPVVEIEPVQVEAKVIEDTKGLDIAALEQDSSQSDAEAVVEKSVQVETAKSEDTELDSEQDSPPPDKEESEPEGRDVFVYDGVTNRNRVNFFIGELEKDGSVTELSENPPSDLLISEVLRKKGASTDNSYAAAVDEVKIFPRETGEVGGKIRGIVFRFPAIAEGKKSSSNEASLKDVERVLGKQQTPNSL